MISSLANRLELARRQRFVGRIAEQDLFKSALAAPDWPFFVLHIFGPGGVGKTTLLREFAALAAQAKMQVLYLDGRNIEPSPASFMAALQQQTDGISWQAYIGKQNGRFLLFIDTAELLSPLDGWLRDEFLPQLPGNLLVVLAGRHPPSLAWRTDPGWQTVMRIIHLRNLANDESLAYLQTRQVPSEEHPAILDFTHGHPLALSLVADVFAQRPGFHFQPEDAPDVIQLLLEKFVQKVPGPAHRAALEASALVRLMTETILAAMLKMPDVQELFEWLRQLSFVESERRGIFLHDLAREALVADLRWRNPDWYAELRQRAHTYYLGRVQQSGNDEQRRLLSSYIFLHRDNPVVRPYFEWQETGTVYTDVFRPSDEPALLAMIQQYEGAESARLAAYWLAHQPQGVSIIRHATGQLQGCLFAVSLTALSQADLEQDVATQTAWAFLKNRAPLRPGETATMFRFWMALDSYQDVSPVQSRIFLNIIQHYLSQPNLAYTFLPCANPGFWATSFAYAGLERLETADFTIGDQRYGVYGHDWRVVPPLAWLGVMTEQQSGVTTSQELPALVVLDEAGFQAAVRDVLRNYTSPELLGASPLLKTRMMAAYAHLPRNEQVKKLQELVRETAVSLQQTPRHARFYAVLHHTYLQPLETQEQVAERLNLPFSTYRRHLRSGIESLTALLWAQELGN